MDVLIVILIAVGLLFVLAVGLFLVGCLCALLISDYGWIIPVVCFLAVIIYYAYSIALEFNLI